MSTDPHRAHFDWCPHGTGNVKGCGVCKGHRDALDARERAGRLEALGWARERLYSDRADNLPPDPRHVSYVAADFDAEIDRLRGTKEGTA